MPANVQPPRLPYAPSWVDAFTAWVERLPGPAWLYYVGLHAALIAFDLVLRAQAGTFELPRVFVWVFLWAVPYDLWLIHYSDMYAGRALDRFRPGLDCGDEAYNELRYRLTTMPPLPVLLAALAGGLFGASFLVILPFDQQRMLLSLTASSATTLWPYQALTIAAFAMAGQVIYHTWHQLRVVNHIYRQHTRVDIFNQQPLFAFSDLSARTALGLLVISFGWSLAAPELLSAPVTIMYVVGFNIICALTFVLPLVGIHNLLKQHKDARLAAIGAQFQSVSVLLHHRVDSKQVADMDNLSKTLLALELERKIVQRTPTWPWNPETPRLIIGLLLLPIVLWLLQTLLERLLSG